MWAQTQVRGSEAGRKVTGHERVWEVTLQVWADSMHMNLRKHQKTVEDREAWRAAVHGVTESGMT